MNTKSFVLFLVSLFLVLPTTLSAQTEITKPPRPQKQQQTTKSTTESSRSTQSTTTSGTSVSNATGSINGHGYVDLGLSVKWATCNVGASSPEKCGDYFAWGETHPKSEYTEDNSVTYCKTMWDIAGNATYDAARANWGGTWRMYTFKEMAELGRNCQWTWTTLNGMQGYKVTAPNGNSIFLPAAGFRDGSGLYNGRDRGYYWCDMPDDDFTSNAFGLYFDSGGYDMNWGSRYYGQQVRPVSE